jgi:D-3-phosphoglycerate dehydrogenase
MKILVCDHYTPEALARLGGIGSVQKSTSFQPVASELAEAEALLIRSRTKIHQGLLEQTPRLKYVVTATSGFDHVDFEACQKRNIQVAYTPEANADAAAEHTFALMLNLVRSVNAGDRAIRRHEWKESLPKTHGLKGLQLGLVGLGRIGQRVAALARAFGLQVAAHDPYLEPEIFKKLEVQKLSLIEIFLSSDIISLHVPLTKETKYLVNHQTLEHFNPEAYLINTARGELIDELELAIRMEEGFLKGVALDVFEKEPLPQDSRLRGLKNAVLTPHVGAYCLDAFAKGSQLAVDELLYMLEGQKSPSQLPLSQAWFKNWIPELS